MDDNALNIQIATAARELSRINAMTPAEYAESVGAGKGGEYGVKLAAMEICSESLLFWLKQAGLYEPESVG